MACASFVQVYRICNIIPVKDSDIWYDSFVSLILYATKNYNPALDLYIVLDIRAKPNICNRKRL